MLSRLGETLARFAQRYVPDPFVMAVALTLVTFAAAFVHTGDAGAVLDAWIDGGRGAKGFWGLLAFAMQMCLILVTGHALAESPPVRRLLDRIALLATTPARATVTVAVSAMALGLVNWGLGLIAGALLARDIGQSARRKGVHVHYPLLVAAGYTGLLVWHGGLSGSAPLKVTHLRDLAEVLGPATAERVGAIPLTRTLASTGNLVANALLLAVIPLALVAMLPREPTLRVAAPALHDEHSGAGEREHLAPAGERLGRSRLLMLAIVLPGLAALWSMLRRQPFSQLSLDSINFAMLFFGIALHGSLQGYVAAIERAAGGCAGILLQFPFYAGIMGLLAGSGVMELLAHGVAAVGATLLPAVAFYMAGLVNLFVPSGGGQWAVQGPLLIEAGLTAGVDPARMVMALAYGDQWTNMLQPFWALPLLAITRVSARDIIGYTAVLTLISQVPFVLGLYL